MDDGTEMATAVATREQQDGLEIIDELWTPSLPELIHDLQDPEAAQQQLVDSYAQDPRGFIERWREVGDIDLRPDDAPTAVLNYLKGFRRDGLPVEYGAAIPIYELHCPWVEGCETSALIERTDERGSNLTIAIAGLKFHGAKKIALKITSQQNSAGRCYTIFFPGTLVVQRWHTPGNEKVLPIYTLADVIPASRARLTTVKQEKILGAHYCGWPFDHFEKPGNIDMRHLLIDSDLLDAADGESSSVSEKTLGTRRFQFPLYLHIPEFLRAAADAAIKVELAISSTVEQGFTLTFNLAGYHHYRGFSRIYEEGPINWIWKSGVPPNDFVF